MPSAHVNGIKLYYEISGSGEPLVLIAGIGYDVWYSGDRPRQPWDRPER
jgi:hypothetical protein